MKTCLLLSRSHMMANCLINIVWKFKIFPYSCEFYGIPCPFHLVQILTPHQNAVILVATSHDRSIIKKITSKVRRIMGSEKIQMNERHWPRI